MTGVYHLFQLASSDGSLRTTVLVLWSIRRYG